MQKSNKNSAMRNIISLLNKIHDKRKESGKRYKLSSILGLVLLGYMVGCTSLRAVWYFGRRLNKTQLKKLMLRAVPSHPTITETMKKVDPEEFSEVMYELATNLSGKGFRHIAIDGKSICSTDNSKDGLLHIVSAYATEIKTVLSQIKSDVTGGEIIAAEKLLNQLDIKDKVITGDAMFAQNKLSKLINNKHGYYIFKVKANKKRLLNDIKQEFTYNINKHLPIKVGRSGVSKASGRIESRCVEVIEVYDECFAGFNGIRQVGRITRKYFTIKTKKDTSEVSYIMTNLDSILPLAFDTPLLPTLIGKCLFIL